TEVMDLVRRRASGSLSEQLPQLGNGSFDGVEVQRHACLARGDEVSLATRSRALHDRKTGWAPRNRRRLPHGHALPALPSRRMRSTVAARIASSTLPMSS